MQSGPERRSSVPARRPARGAAVVGALVAIAISATPAVAQGQGEWPQFQGGPLHEGSAPGPEPAYTEAWAVEVPLGGPTGTLGLSAPVVADGAAIVVAPDVVLAVDVATGEDRWRAERAPGPPVAPAIVDAGGEALVVFPEGFGPNAPGLTPSPSPSPSPSPAGDGEDGPSGVELVAVGLADGDERWRAPLPSPSRSGVAAGDGAVYVGTNDGRTVALDAVTGEVRWTSPVGASVIAPPAVADGLVLVSAVGDGETAFSLVALRVDDGSTAWRYEPPVAASVGGPPSVAGDAVLVGLEDRSVRAVGLSDGVERWSARLNAVTSPLVSAAVAGDAVLALDIAGQVYRLERDTGRRAWDHALNVDVIQSPPVVSGDHVLVASASGELFALEFEGGDLVWRDDLAGGVLRTLAVTGDAILGVRGGGRAGLLALAHDPGGPLIREVTPTAFDPGRFASSLAIAAVVVVAAALLLGRLLAARLGRVAPIGPPPRDPLEDALEEAP